jgi:hypothetical protein
MSRQGPADNRRTAPLSQECIRVRARLLPFLDGELDGNTRLTIQRHLDACADCRNERDWQLQSDRALERAQQYVPEPGDLRAAFYARLAESPPHSRPLWTTHLRLAVPACAVAAFAIILIKPQPQQPAPKAGLAGSSSLRPILVDKGTGKPNNLSPFAPHPNPDGQRPLSGLAANGPNERSKMGNVRNDAYNHAITHVQLSGKVRTPSMMMPGSDSRLAYVRLPEIAMRGSSDANIPHVKLPPITANSLTAMYDNSGQLKSPAGDLAGNNDQWSYKESTLAFSAGVAAAGTPMAFGRAKAETTRAELMNEEVNVHIVNAQNEEVESVHVTSGATPATDGSTVHVEADVDPDNAGP